MPLSIRSCRVVARRRQEEVGGGSLWLQDLSVGSVTFVGSLRPVSFRVASCVVYVKNKLISQVRSFFPCLFPVFFACLCAAAAMCRKGGMTLDRPTDQPNEHERTQTDIIPENSLSNENGLATRSATRNANQSPKRRNHGKTGCGRYGFTASLGLGN